MAFKSTLITLTTTPSVLIGPTSSVPVVNVSAASPSDPVQVSLSVVLGSVYLSGSSAAIGATPTVWLLPLTATDQRNCLALEFTGPDTVFAASTVTTGVGLQLVATRQQTP